MRSHLAATAAYEPISMSHQLLGPDSSTLGPLARAVAPMCAARAMRADAVLIGPEAKRECRAVVISQQAMYEHQRHRTMIHERHQGGHGVVLEWVQEAC